MKLTNCKTQPKAPTELKLKESGFRVIPNSHHWLAVSVDGRKCDAGQFHENTDDGKTQASVFNNCVDYQVEE